MRLIAVAALASACCLALPASALSEPILDRGYLYAAADAGYLFAQGGGAKTFDIGLGLRNRHYGIEAGYVGIFANSSTLSGGYVDGNGYLPLGRRLSLFATGGAAYVNARYAPSFGYVRNQLARGPAQEPNGG